MHNLGLFAYFVVDSVSQNDERFGLNLDCVLSFSIDYIKLVEI